VENLIDYLNLDRFTPWLEGVAAWFTEAALTGHTLGQVLLIVYAFGAGRLLAWWVRPVLRRWNARRTVGVAFVNRLIRQLTAILALIQIWLAYDILRREGVENMTPILRITASLLVAWVVIHFATLVVRNRRLAKIVALAAWTIAALDIVGLLDPLVEVLDGLAVTVGELRISLYVMLKAALLLLILVWASLALVALAEKRLTQSTVLPSTTQVLISKVLKFVLITIAVLFAINAVGIDLTGVALLTGALGVGLGFGLQRPFSNLISGVIMLLDGSIRPGDVIELEGTFGWVSRMGARAVALVTRDNKEILVPNEDFIVNRAINWSHSAPEVRHEVRFTVTYAADPHKVREVAARAALEPDRVLKDPPPICHLTEFADDGLSFCLRFWINDPTRGVTNVTGQVLLAVWDAFDAEGIRFPYPHRQLVVDQPVPVRLADAPAPPATPPPSPSSSPDTSPDTSA